MRPRSAPPRPDTEAERRRAEECVAPAQDCQASPHLSTKVSSRLLRDPLMPLAPRHDEPEPEPNTAKVQARCASPGELWTRKPGGKAVFFFDWDDTILCTSFMNLSDADCASLSPDTARHLQGIQEAAGRLLDASLKLGYVFIVTNSVEGWVEHSAARWLPRLVPLLRQATIIAARDEEGPRYPGEVNTWKKQAFADVVQRLGARTVVEIVSLGDSSYEIDAARSLGELLPQALIKTVKLKEKPTAEELAKELQVVWQSFRRIADKSHNLSISLERTWVSQ